MQIWKYNLGVDRHQMIVMPKGAVLLDFQGQKGQLALWACVNPKAPKVKRDLSVIGTGYSIPGGEQTYIGTTQTSDGLLVWHLFDGGEV